MDRDEIRAMIEEGKQRDAKWKAQRLEELKAEFPALEIDESKAKLVDVTDLIYQLNSEQYYLVYQYGVSLRQTDFGFDKEYIEKFNQKHEIFINPGCEPTFDRIVLIESRYSWEVHTTEYYKDNGHRLRGSRRHRKIYESSKGKYINYKGSRHYVSFLNEGGQSKCN